MSDPNRMFEDNCSRVYINTSERKNAICYSCKEPLIKGEVVGKFHSHTKCNDCSVRAIERYITICQSRLQYLKEKGISKNELYQRKTVRML